MPNPPFNGIHHDSNTSKTLTLAPLIQLKTCIQYWCNRSQNITSSTRFEVFRCCALSSFRKLWSHSIRQSPIKRKFPQVTYHLPLFYALREPFLLCSRVCQKLITMRNYHTSSVLIFIHPYLVSQHQLLLLTAPLPTSPLLPPPSFHFHHPSRKCTILPKYQHPQTYPKTHHQHPTLRPLL